MAMVKKVMGHKAAMTNALVAAWLALAALGGVCAQPAPQHVAVRASLSVPHPRDCDAAPDDPRGRDYRIDPSGVYERQQQRIPGTSEKDPPWYLRPAPSERGSAQLYGFLRWCPATATGSGKNGSTAAWPARWELSFGAQRLAPRCASTPTAHDNCGLYGYLAAAPEAPADPAPRNINIDRRALSIGGGGRDCRLCDSNTGYHCGPPGVPRCADNVGTRYHRYGDCRRYGDLKTECSDIDAQGGQFALGLRCADWVVSGANQTCDEATGQHSARVSVMPHAAADFQWDHETDRLRDGGCFPTTNEHVHRMLSGAAHWEAPESHTSETGPVGTCSLSDSWWIAVALWLFASLTLLWSHWSGACAWCARWSDTDDLLAGLAPLESLVEGTLGAARELSAVQYDAAESALRWMLRILRHHIDPATSEASRTQMQQQVETSLVQLAHDASARADQAVEESDRLTSAHDYDRAMGLLEPILQSQRQGYGRDRVEDRLQIAVAAKRGLTEAKIAAVEGRAFLAAGMWDDAKRCFTAGMTQPTHEQAVRNSLQKGLETAAAGHSARTAIAHADIVVKSALDGSNVSESDGSATIVTPLQALSDCSHILQQAIASGFESESLVAAQRLSIVQKREEDLRKQQQAQQGVSETKTLLADGNSELASELVDSFLESELLTDESRSALSSLRRQAKKQQQTRDVAHNRLMEGKDLHAARMFADAIKAYESGLQSAPDVDTRAKIESGRNESLESLLSNQAARRTVLSTIECLKHKDYQAALAHLQTQIAAQPTTGDISTESETESESDDEHSETSDGYVDPEEHTEYVLGLSIEEWFSSCEAATAAFEKATVSSEELHISEDSSGDPTMVSVSSEATERSGKRDFINDKRIIAARQFIACGAYDAAIPLLRGVLGEEVAENELHLQLENDLFESLVAQSSKSLGDRKKALQQQMQQLDPNSAQFEQASLALQRLESEMSNRVDNTLNDAELSDFQRLPDVEREDALTNGTIGVSIEWWREFVRTSRETVWDIDPSKITQASVEQFIQGLHAARNQNDLDAESSVSRYRESTQAVFDLVIEPKLSNRPGSFIKQAFSDDANMGAQLGVANIYVSHSPVASFAGLDSAIESHVERAQLESSDTFLWLDFLSMDLRDLAPNNERSIQCGIAEAQTTLAVLEPWDSPVMLRTTQCLYEILQASVISCPVVAVMSSVDYSALRQALAIDGVEHVQSCASLVCPGDLIHPKPKHYAARMREIGGEESDITVASIVSECIASLARGCDMRGLVWLNNASTAGNGDPIVGEMSTSSTDEAVVEVSTGGQSFRVELDDIQHVNIPAQNLVDDLTQLDFMSSLSILNTLRHRYCGGLPCHDGDHSSWYCTFIGNILIYINPYNPQGVWKNDYSLADYLKVMSSVRESGLQPHPYAIADMALRQLLDVKTDQAVYVAGESGAGKTEACKMMLEFLMAALMPATGSGPSVASVLGRSDHALEAFGNARTINNENSSRFVKYVKLQIVDPPVPKRAKTAFEIFCDQRRASDHYRRLAQNSTVKDLNAQLSKEWKYLLGSKKREYSSLAEQELHRFAAETAAHSSSKTGQLVGASVNASLLERNRVVGLTSGDPFHIFKYIQQADAHAASQSFADTASESSSGSPDLDSVAKWMCDINLSEAEVEAAFNIVRATQSLLALRFDGRGCVIMDGALIKLAAELGVEQQQLAVNVNFAVSPGISMGSEKVAFGDVSTTATSARARSTQASIAKTFYDGVFDIVLQQFNQFIGQDARFFAKDCPVGGHTCSVCSQTYVVPEGMHIRRSKYMCLDCYTERQNPMFSTIGDQFDKSNTCVKCSQSAAPTIAANARWGGRCSFCRRVHCVDCSTTSLPRVALLAASQMGTTLGAKRVCYSCLSKMSVSTTQDARTLGVLDIFGCERFEQNSLDVLCVNFVNERMHQSFLAEVFHVEKAVYESEGIDLHSAGISFQDNAHIIELLSGKPSAPVAQIQHQETLQRTASASCNVFTILNQAQAFGSDVVFHRDLQHQLRSQLNCAVGTFAVQHYFGSVVYGGEEEYGFCAKNRDQTYDGFFVWWRENSRNALASRLSVVNAVNAYRGADVARTIVEDTSAHTDMDTQLRKVLRRTIPDELRQLPAFRAKGRVSTSLPSGWKARKAGRLGTPEFTQYHYRRRRPTLSPPVWHEDDDPRRTTQYIPPSKVDMQPGTNCLSFEVTLAVIDVASVFFNAAGELIASTTGQLWDGPVDPRQPRDPNDYHGEGVVVVTAHVSFEVQCNDRGQARVTDVQIPDKLRVVTLAGLPTAPFFDTRTVTRRGAQDLVATQLARRLMKVAQTRTAWLYAKTEDVDKLGGLSMKTRSDESTVDQLKHGTDALFSSISAETRPNFIRCINPKRAGEPVAASMRERFAQQHVLQQLTNCGKVSNQCLRRIAGVCVLLSPQIPVFWKDRPISVAMHWSILYVLFSSVT